MWLVVKVSENICGRVRGVLGGIPIVAFAVHSDGLDNPASDFSSSSCSSPGDRIN